jgi:serine/threonine protein phosphatase PrpC
VSGTGVVLYTGQQRLEPEVWSIAGGVAAVCSIRAPGKPTSNEDSVCLVPVGEGAALLAVADGVGGQRGGQRASGLALRCLAEAAVAAGAAGAGLRSAVLDGFERANQAVQALGFGAATTLAVAAVGEGGVRTYHVGDSSVLVVGQRGQVKLETVAHSPVGFAVEAGMIGVEEAMHHEERHVVSNVLGAPDMRIEVGSTLRLAARDTVLVASDGLLDNLHRAEIVARIRRGPLESAARCLADDARRRMLAPAVGEPSKPDDLSFVLFRPAGR